MYIFLNIIVAAAVGFTLQCKLLLRRCGNHKKLEDPDGIELPWLSSLWTLVVRALIIFVLWFFFSLLQRDVWWGLRNGVGWRGLGHHPPAGGAIKSNLLTVTHKNGHTKRRAATDQAQAKQTKTKTEPETQKKNSNDNMDGENRKVGKCETIPYDIIKSL